jgi:hypothetical protein
MVVLVSNLCNGIVNTIKEIERFWLVSNAAILAAFRQICEKPSVGVVFSINWVIIIQLVQRCVA